LLSYTLRHRRGHVMDVLAASDVHFRSEAPLYRGEKPKLG